VKKAALAMALALIATVGLFAAPPRAARGSTTPQNVVLILTDDQRWDSLQYMPNVESLLVAHGVTFTNAFDNNPLCCPTRATIMTGLTSGHNNVWNNKNSPDGGFQGFVDNGDQNHQIFGWLHGAGYTTALVGKFLNFYLGGTGKHSDVKWIMPGADDWQAFLLNSVSPSKTGCQTGGYWATCYSNMGTLEEEPSTAYSTTTSGQKAVDFINGAKSGQPLFLYYAPRAPHLPTIPEPKYANACTNVTPIDGSNTPSYNQPIVNGPAYMESLPHWNPKLQQKEDLHWVDDCRTLLSVDDQVAAIVQALANTGRLSNTLIMFASDNGLAFGEHRWQGKIVPYEESIRVPVVIRDDAVIPASVQGTSSSQDITSLDYTPTFLQAAGVTEPGLDGQSLFPLIGGDGTWTPQSSILLEYGAGGGGDGGDAQPATRGVEVPSYCGIRSATYMYAQYSTGEQELYDLASDPYELTNVAGEAPYQSVLKSMRQQAHQLCKPTPPDFTWTH